MRTDRLIMTLLVLAGAFALTGAARAGESSDRWYVLELSGERAGWAREQQTVIDGGLVRTASDLKIKILRMGQEISIGVGTEFVETADGVPVSMSSVQDMGMLAVNERYEFKADRVEQVSTQAGRETRRTHPLPEGQWMTPARAAAYVSDQMDSGATTITYTSIDPSAGLKLVTNTIQVIGPTKIQVVGKTVPAVELSVTQSVMPGVVSTEYVDNEGGTLRTVFSFGGIEMTMTQADKAIALSELDAPELMANTLIKPDVVIDHPRTIRRAQYVLTVPEGVSIPDLPITGVQRVHRVDERTVRITVDLENTRPAPDDETTDDRFRSSSTNADSDDPMIVALVEQALAGASDDPADQAEHLRRFVHGYIEEKTLGVGFATASEVCRTREGDCTEHGVLLAAMLRAAGIPSRAVSGVIYVDSFGRQDGIFGYHLWTQALLEVGGSARWVDLDATLPDETPFDAAHIALSTSSLDDADVINSMASLVNVLGQLEIEVEDVK